MPRNFEQLRSLILKRKEETADLLKRLKKEAQSGDVRHADAYDQAAHSYDLQFLSEQSARAERELRLLDDALSRIQAGRYGSCGLCGEPISDARLKAIPWARHCVVCQQHQERGS